MRRVGVLIPLNERGARRRVAALQEGLGKLGWIEGRNIQIELRWSGADEELSRQYALELVALAPDVIVLQSTQALRAVRSVNRDVPLVIGNASDLVEMGVVDSLAHPGGNTTGFTFAEFSISSKWLELLKAIAPHLVRVLNVHHPSSAGFRPAIEASAAAFAVQVMAAPVRNSAEIASAIAAFAREPNGGLIMHPHPVIGDDLIIRLAARHGLPAMYPYVGFVESGGLICYGIDWMERWRSMAGYVDLILRGTRPADLPVQSAAKIELAINLRTAKALELTVPPRLLARADRVIE
jgi:putative ABC transport system substrate-binding protein